MLQMEDKRLYLSKQTRAAKLLEEVSCIYKNCFLCDEIFKEQFKDSYQALDCFLSNYAYERQGAAAAYPRIAHECISGRYRNGHQWSVPTKKDAEHLWKDYGKIAAARFNLADKVNAKLNPMNEEEGVIDRLASSDVSNIATHTRDLMADGDTAQAYDFMKSIRGVGEKISSFYLRDIAYLADLDESSISDVYLLQPIDTWLEQTLRILFGSNAPRSVKEKQRLVVDLCSQSEVSSIAFNQGAWVLGSQIAGEFEPFRRALVNRSFAQDIVKRHIDGKERYLREVKHVLDSLHHKVSNSA